MDEEVVNSNQTHPVDRMRHRVVEGERKGKNQSKAKMVHLAQEPISTEALGEPTALQQLENDSVYTKIHTVTPPHQQVTKNSDKPQVTSATTPTTPTKTNKRRKKNKTLNSAKGKRKTTPQTHFPYFKDDYCPPECACYGR